MHNLLLQDVPAFENSNIIDPSLVDTNAAAARPSTAVLSLSFAFNKTLSPLAHHSLFLSDDFKESWDVVEQSKFEKGYNFNPEACNFYVHAPSRTDKSACPEGHDAITVLIPMPLSPSGVDSSFCCGDSSNSSDIEVIETTYIDSLRKQVLERLQTVEGMPSEITSHIIYEQYRSASNWKRDFELYRGSAFGLVHSIDQLSFLRPRIQHPNIKNLYRVGASCRPGNGVPLVMIGARLSAEKILRDISSD